MIPANVVETKMANENIAKSISKTFIVAPPINSSGDIYHVISLIILLLEHNNSTVPEILLSYDTESDNPNNITSKVQVMRSINFADALGYKMYFLPPKIFDPKNAYRQNHRQCKMIDYFQDQSTHDKCTYHYLDQKLSTSYIANAFLQNKSQTHQALYAGFSQVNPTIVSPAAQGSLKEYSAHWIKRIKNSRRNPDQPVILLHVRFSSDANEKQNLPDSFVLKFSNYLREKTNSCVWFLFADGRSKGSFIGIKGNRISPFQKPLKKDKDNYIVLNKIEESLKEQNPSFDFGKMKHLQLALDLKQIEGLRVIGNTSGTLDLFSFVGHCVYNIHAFTGNTIAYQDYRILIQMSFSTIEKFNQVGYEAGQRKEKFESTDIERILENFATWFAASTNPINPTITFVAPTMTNEGYWELVYCKDFNPNPNKTRYIVQQYTQTILSFVQNRFEPEENNIITNTSAPQPISAPLGFSPGFSAMSKSSSTSLLSSNQKLDNKQLAEVEHLNDLETLCSLITSILNQNHEADVLETIQTIASLSGINVHAKGKNGLSPLELAAEIENSHTRELVVNILNPKSLRVNPSGKVEINHH